MKRTSPLYQHGLTLIELTVVLLVLIGLGGLLLPFVGGTTQFSQCTATDTSMRAIRDAITGSFEQPGYFEDMNSLPIDLRGLLLQNFCLEDETLLTQVACTGTGNTWITQPQFNPVTKRGWNGPYMFSDAKDAYNFNDIIIQTPTVDGDGNDCIDIDLTYIPQDCSRIVSIGPDNALSIQLDDANGTVRGDDRILYLLLPDPAPIPIPGPTQPCTELFDDA